MRGPAAVGVVVSLLLLLLLLDKSHTSTPVANLWQRGLSTWFPPHLRPVVAGSVSSHFWSQGRTVFPPRPSGGPGSSHLWSAASYYPRWPDRVRHDFTTEEETSHSRDDARQPRRLPLVQARHQINNPRQQEQDNSQVHRKPSSVSLWYWD
ncbi:uncharacterized protein LOC123514756 [Portunus trituberculatus]|uniref:uncharacterized protein LOC123514756 n=1 Tax=Portunus trituberculatus TaxID=210409 RepID=UPI001E1CE9AC|nr:uncharacterized protein LOC123514756 [Portunus trituberculatus]